MLEVVVVVNGSWPSLDVSNDLKACRHSGFEERKRYFVNYWQNAAYSAQLIDLWFAESFTIVAESTIAGDRH